MRHSQATTRRAKSLTRVGPRVQMFGAARMRVRRLERATRPEPGSVQAHGSNRNYFPRRSRPLRAARSHALWPPKFLISTSAPEPKSALAISA